MKKLGCTVKFTQQRNTELIGAYRCYIDKCSVIDVRQTAVAVANSPASRFWVSEERARIVMLALLANKPVLNKMIPTKREMFTEIYRRYLSLIPQYPDASSLELATLAVNSPAPKFYMTPASVMEIIYRIKKGYYAK